MTKAGRICAAIVGAVPSLVVAVHCAAAPPPPEPAATPAPVARELGKPFTLAVGERAELDSGRLALVFVSVPEDSRCPKKEQCISAGNARVILDVSVGGAVPAVISLDTNRAEPEVEVDRYVLHLDGLAPVPVSGRPIPSESYRATLSLRPR